MKNDVNAFRLGGRYDKVIISHILKRHRINGWIYLCLEIMMIHNFKFDLMSSYIHSNEDVIAYYVPERP